MGGKDLKGLPNDGVFGVLLKGMKAGIGPLDLWALAFELREGNEVEDRGSLSSGGGQ